MKIFSWNIRQGGGTRAEGIAQAILSQKADVVILSEFQNNASGQLIRIRLLMDGFIFQSPSTDDKKNNGVLIATRSSCNFVLDQASPDFPEAVLICNIAGIIIYGVYLPHKKKHKGFEYILSKLSSLPYPSIIAGDFNTGFNYIDQQGDSFWYQDQLRVLQKNKMIDAWRHIHQDKKEYSWYSHQGNGYRYDHTWVSETLVSKIKSCDYVHSLREQNLADHSGMLLEFL